MKIAIISDIHGNLEALKATLKDIEKRKVYKIKNENPAASLDELKVIAAKKCVLLYYHVYDLYCWIYS